MPAVYIWHCPDHSMQQQRQTMFHYQRCDASTTTNGSSGTVATPTWFTLHRCPLFPSWPACSPSGREERCCSRVKHNILGNHCHLVATINTVHYSTTSRCFTNSLTTCSEGGGAPGNMPKSKALIWLVLRLLLLLYTVTSRYIISDHRLCFALVMLSVLRLTSKCLVCHSCRLFICRLPWSHVVSKTLGCGKRTDYGGSFN